MSKTVRILKNVAFGICMVSAGPMILYAQSSTDMLSNEMKTAVQEAQAEEAIAKAQQNTIASRLGGLGNVQNTGNVTTGNSAGQAEVEILASVAVQAAADVIGQRLCQLIVQRANQRHASCRVQQQFAEAVPERPRLTYAPLDQGAICDDLGFEDTYPDTRPSPNAWRPLIFVTQTDFAAFDAYDTFSLRLSSAARNMCHMLALATEATNRTAELRSLPDRGRAAPGATSPVVGGSFIATAAAALNTVASLVRTEYNIQGVSLTPDQRLLARETMLAFVRRMPDTPVFAPTLFPTIANAPNNPLIRKLEVLDRLGHLALDEARVQARYGQLLNAKRTTVADAHVEAVTNGAGLHNDMRTALVEAVKAYTDLVQNAANPANNQPSLLATSLRQARSVQLMRQGGILVVTEANRVGGSTLTRRNFFTAFGPMPFYVSGVALVSYSVMDGSTGQMLDAGTIPMAGGYEQIRDLHDRFSPDAAVRARRRGR